MIFNFSDTVRSQNAPINFAYGWRNDQAWDQMLSYLKNNWPDLLKKFGNGGRMLGYMIKPMSGVNDSEKITEIRKFFNENIVPAGEMTVKQMLELMDANEYRLIRDYNKIVAYLHRNKL